MFYLNVLQMRLVASISSAKSAWHMVGAQNSALRFYE